MSSRASSRVGGFLRAESRLSQIPKPEQEEGETKAQYAWRLIRQSVRDAIDVVALADEQDKVITHGIHHCRSLNHAEPLSQVIYNKTTKEYLTLDGRVVRTFMQDGRKKEVVMPEEKIDRIIHAAPLNLYIAWIHEHHEIFLLDHDFNILSMAEAPGPILALVYNHNISEIVTVGPGLMTSWVFRYGGRHLMARKTTTEGLEADQRFTALVLEESGSRGQKAFASLGCSVAMFNVFEGELLCWKHELHTRKITAMLFFNPLKFLVTAAKDGSIKVWDEKWHLQLVFVGHEGMVSTLAIYPYGPVIMSASTDCTIRIWSLETCDEVDKVDMPEPVRSLVTIMNDDNFCSMSDHHADLWKVHHIHQLHSTIGHKVMQVKSTDHPSFPVRSVMMCADSSVRILSPTSGDVITTLLMNPKRWLVDAAYAIAEDNLFAVFANGDIIKCNTATNPCTIISQWKCKDPKKACNYLLVYEYVITADLQSDTWGGMKRAIATKGLAGSSSSGTRGANRTLLLGGRKDGQICVFDWDTGAVEFEIEGHGTKGVLSMIANSKSDQLISAGLDNIIKVWRLYPYAQESLAPLLSFYCAHTPLYMTVMRDKLAVAFQEHTTATYSVVMYSLQTKNRHDHGPEDDHMDSLKGLTSCPKMKLIASCSSDGTIHIWNEHNNLVRLIRLNAQPQSLAFCSPKGDLLVGIGEHVHRIDYKAYMPRAYRFKMVSMQFPVVKSERAIAFDDNTLNMMHRDDVKRLKAARSSFKFTHFMDVLTDEENTEVVREKETRQQAFSELEERENEIALIRDGGLQAKRKPKATPATKRDAFNKYLKIFFDRPKITLYQEDPYAADLGHMEEEKRKDTVLTEVPGFFPSPSSARKPADLKEEDPPLPIQAGGFVPNSVLARLLWPQYAEKEVEKENNYVPPCMTAEQMAHIASLNKKPSWHKPSVKLRTKQPKSTIASRLKMQESADFREQPIFLDYADDEESHVASQGNSRADSRAESILSDKSSQKVAEETRATTPQSAAGSSFMDKMKQIMEKPPTPPRSATPEPVTVTPPTTPKATTPRPPVEALPQRKPAPPRRQIVKLVSRPEPTPVAVVAAPPPREPTPPPPPPPPTPLPEFIAQFIGQQWFDRYFPDCSSTTLPKPWTMVAFVNMLLKAVHVADYPEKVAIVQALSKLHREDGIPNGHSVHQSLLSFMASSSQPPSCQDPTQKEFIRESMVLIQNLGIWDRDLYCELMTQFLEADNELRSVILDLFRQCGLRDPQAFFPRELDNWDVWNLEDSERTTELRKMSRQWLEKWLTSFKMHLEDAIEKLKKGQNVSGRVGRGKQKDNRPKSILKRHQIDMIEEEDPTHMEGVQMISSTQPSSETSSTTNKLITVTFDRPPDPASVDNATYMEALNYFCEMEMEKELEKMRRPGAASRAPSVSDARPTEDKNTVLVLPKLPGRSALVRLGETHTSKCRPHRETAFADLKLPPIIMPGKRGELGAFPPCLNLPLKTCYMNPFPSPLDQLELLAQQPLLLTLRTAQKYFVPSRSYIPPQDSC